MRNRLSSIQHFIRMRVELAQRLLLFLSQDVDYGDLMQNYFPLSIFANRLRLHKATSLCPLISRLWVHEVDFWSSSEITA